MTQREIALSLGSGTLTMKRKVKVVGMTILKLREMLGIPIQ